MCATARTIVQIAGLSRPQEMTFASRSRALRARPCWHPCCRGGTVEVLMPDHAADLVGVVEALYRFDLPNDVWLSLSVRVTGSDHDHGRPMR